MNSKQDIKDDTLIDPISIFQTANLADLILRAIQGGDLESELARSRADKIKDFFPIGVNIYLAKEEVKLIGEIANLLQQLCNYMLSKDVSKQKNCCDKIFKLIYCYINYRVTGIMQHLQTGDRYIYRSSGKSINTIYYSLHWGEIYITESFAAHKEKNFIEINKYLKSSVFNSVLLQLQTLVPSLLLQPKTIEESLLDSRNIYNEPGINFVAPPYIEEINHLLKLLNQIYLNNVTPEVNQQLGIIVNKFNAKHSYKDILELVYKIYVPIECLAFWPGHDINNREQHMYFKLCLATGLDLSHLIPYSLLDISDTEIKKAEKILQQKNKDTQDKISAGRILKYAAIPWMLIQNISVLLLKSSQNNWPDIEQTIFEANNELGSAWQNLLNPLQDLIAYEISVATREVNFAEVKFTSVAGNHYFLLKCLGDYAGDVLFLNKIISVLSELDYTQPFYIETYLRLLGILGESAKSLSPFITKLMSERYWQALAKIRDKTAHTTGYLRRIQKVLKDNSMVAEALKKEFQLLLEQAKIVKQSLPNDWAAIKTFYQQNIIDLNLPVSSLGNSLNQLLENMDAILTAEDYKALRATKSHVCGDLTAKRDQVLKILNKEAPANSVDQASFFSLVDNLFFLSSKQKKDIKEIYKKLKQGRDAKLSDAIYKTLTEAKFMSSADLDLAIEALIKALKGMDKPETLKRELAKIGLEGAYVTWEEKHKKYNKQTTTPSNKNEINNIWSLDKVLLDSINAANNILDNLQALKDLVTIRKTNKKTNKILPVEQFGKDPILCHAVEFYFIRLRNYVDIIQEALSYLPRYHTVNQTDIILNQLYTLLMHKLKNIRLYGNSLAHLHDVTNWDGRTPYGYRLTAYQELFAALKNHKVLSSLRRDIHNYVNYLKEKLEENKQNLVKKLEENRKTFETVYKCQQQILSRVPHLKLSDYQILTTLHRIDETDPDKALKHQLYKATEKLFQLQQEYIDLQNLIPPASTRPRTSSNATKYAKTDSEKLIFEEEEVVGDGWCTLNAIGIAEPSKAIIELKTQLKTSAIINYIRRAIYNNYQASIALGEEFNIEGVDQNNNSIKDKIFSLYLNCQNTNNSQQEYLTMMSYLENPSVQIAYINYLLKTKYVDSNIAAACLHSQGKKIALFIDYNSHQGQLFNAIEDNISATDPNTIYLVFHPNGRQSLAHYNCLKLIAVEPLNAHVAQQSVSSSTVTYVANYSNANLVGSLSSILSQEKTTEAEKDEEASLDNKHVFRK